MFHRPRPGLEVLVTTNPHGDASLTDRVGDLDKILLVAEIGDLASSSSGLESGDESGLGSGVGHGVRFLLGFEGRKCGISREVPA